jgi:hypothetical protein
MIKTAKKNFAVFLFFADIFKTLIVITAESRKTGQKAAVRHQIINSEVWI